MRLGKSGKRTEKIVGAVAVAVVVLSISSYWTGSRVEQQFRESMDLMARYGATHNFKVNVVDYQRGVFWATAHTDVVFQTASLDDPSIMESVTVPIIHSIRHGPLPALTAAARIRSEAQLTDEAVAFFFNETFDSDPFEGKVPLAFDTVIGWAGGRHSRVVSPGFEMPAEKDQAKVSWSGLNGEISVNSNGIKVEIDGLSYVRNDDDLFRLGRIVFESSMTLAEGFERVYTGTTGITLDNLHFRGKDDNGVILGVEFEKFRIAGNASVKDGALDTEVNLDAERITVEGGTKEAADSLKLTFLLENIDASAYDAILQAMDQEGQTAEISTVLEKQGEILLRRRPAFHIKEASGRWPEGVATGSFRIAYEGEAKPDDLSISSLSGLSGDLQLVVPRALVTRHISSQVSRDIADSLEDGEENEVNIEKETTEQVARKMAEMLEKGIFVEKGDALAVDARLRDGELNLNAKQQPIQTLLELLPPFFF
ncbi:MAG: YdgA family protein [Betaproteobacteria bacterium]|nr:YdgA family protein [Betaproteobacteria bacterium]